jgi:hypothetical protein
MGFSVVSSAKAKQNSENLYWPEPFESRLEALRIVHADNLRCIATTQRQRLVLWMDGECFRLRRQSRRLERRYRGSQTAEDRLAWVQRERKRHAVSADEVLQTIISSQSKSCDLDPLPTEVLKKFVPELLPYITDMCNASLQQGNLPQSQRHATVTPRLKKAGLDESDVKNYRPISNLTFMSKVVERLVCRQLVAFLEQHGLLPVHQSAYRRHHSTETAVLKVVSDLLLAADKGQVTLLALLDLSAAFDTVDHSILLDRLRLAFGVRGTPIQWIQSFVTNRSQTVSFAGERSAVSAVTCGVPQGSVLGPILFLLYCADVTIIAQRHGVCAHSYADDSQLYVHCSTSECTSAITRLTTCMQQLDSWMASNRLRLNADKTQFIWIGSRQQLKKIQCPKPSVGGHVIEPLHSVTLLGVEIDAELTFATHIKRVSARCFHQLRQLWSVRTALSIDNVKMLVHALISSRVDYCNSILYHVTAVHLRPLQLVINAAARLIVKKRKYDRITSTIRDMLHWLPVRQRIEYKLCLFVFKSLHQKAPSYLTSVCTQLTSDAGRRHLRSAAHGDLSIPRTRTASYGPRSFSSSGPTCWNSLPAELKDFSLTVEQFCSQLKTELFRRGYA